MKRAISLIAAALIAVSFIPSCKKSGNPTDAAETTLSGADVTNVSTDDDPQDTKDSVTDDPENEDTDEDANDGGNEMFSDGDRKDVTSGGTDATVILAGSEGTISDTARGSSGREVVIRSKGIYHVVGTSDDVTIRIYDENKSGNVYLILDNVTMTNSDAPCIYVERADKVVLRCVGSNSLTYTSVENELDGAIFAKDDLTVNGDGSLAITSSLHGVVAENDLRLLDVTLDVQADLIGIRAGDSVRVCEAGLIVKSGHDGVRVSNSDGDSFLYFESGSASVSAGYDGIDVGTEANSFYGYVSFVGGSINITAGGGSDNPKSSDVSQKGIKCDGNIVIGKDSAINISSADDAINSGYNVDIAGGATTLSSGDDAIHAANVITVAGGVLSVMKSYEGLEAYSVTIFDGDISVMASDDGVNAGGGSDQSSDEADHNWDAAGDVTISGGTLYINAGGDGIDSNGSIFVTDGFTIIEGSVGANSAIDKGDSAECTASITGGCVLALGGAEKAINFDGGTQCSALLSLSGAAGDRIAVGDGTGFTYSAQTPFSCVLYSSPMMQKGNKYPITAGKSSVDADFSSSLFYTDVSSDVK